MIQFIADIDHYKVILEQVKTAKSLLWIGTADIKDLHVKTGLHTEPFLGVLEQFDSVWRGENCKNCGRRNYCGDPIIK